MPGQRVGPLRMVGQNLIQQNVVQPGTQVRMMLQQGQTIRGNEIVSNPGVGQQQQQPQQQQQIVHQTISNVGGNQTILAGSPQIQKQQQQQPPPYPEPPPPYPGQSQVIKKLFIIFS